LTDNERLIIAYSNLGSILRSKQDYKNAERCLKTAIDLTLKVGDKEQEIFNKQSLADVYYLQGNYVLARQILLPLLDQAKEHQYYEELGNTALTLYSVEKAMGNFENAVAYLEVYNMAQDTLENRMEQTQLLALQEKYAAEEKAKEIELLSKDAELNDRKIEQQRIVIASITGLFLLVVIVLALLIGRFRMNRQVKELQLRNRLALDLHDEVGSSLSSIKMLSEMAVKQKENREIVQRIAGNARETVDRMGDIIWMINPKYDHFIDLKKRMEMYLEDICLHKNIQHAFLDKLPETIQLSMQQRKNLLLVFKEAVNNAAKYSGANFIQVNIYMREDNVVLEVIDNGKGFDMLSIVKGNGLTSMELRANELHGQIKVQSEYNKGTSILLSFKA
jgi:two-component system sensor histidine kinase UhpB